MVTLQLVLNKYGIAFRWDIYVVLYGIIKHKQNVVKHNSVDDFIKVHCYIVLSATYFGSSYEPSSGWLLFRK